MIANAKVAGAEKILDRWQARRSISPSLHQVFDPKSNALNTWRLVLATGVIFWHSWPLTRRHISFAPAHQLLAYGWVDGFFAISGFLITWSWFKNPRVRDYFVARGLRILPGFWVCLIITAFIIAPTAVAIQRGPAAKLLLSRAPIAYVLENSAVVIRKQGIDGTPRGVPWQGFWNGSLWTLSFEVLCYVAIAVLGVVGLLRRRWLIPTALVLALFWSARLPQLSGSIDEPPNTQPHIDVATAVPIMESVTARFAIMFLAGALIYQFRNVIPARWSLVALSVVIVLAASVLPDYRLVAAIPLAYAIITSGALIHNKRFSLRTDLSYGMYVYAFPIQQVLIICGLGILNPIFFAIIAVLATLPLAALSWFLVEKRALSLKSRFERRNIAPVGERQPR